MKPSAEKKNNKSAGRWQRFSGSRLSHPAVWLFWIAVWFLLSLLVHRELLLPGPLQVLQKLGSMMLTGAFWSSVALSLLRILGGILAALILGVLLAILTEYSSLAKALFSPLMLLVRSTPVVSFIILALIWLGRDILPLFISALMVLPVVWANVSAGIAGRDPQLLEGGIRSCWKWQGSTDSPAGGFSDGSRCRRSCRTFGRRFAPPSASAGRPALPPKC